MEPTPPPCSRAPGASRGEEAAPAEPTPGPLGRGIFSRVGPYSISGPRRALGLARDAVAFGDAGAAYGFGIAGVFTDYGFGAASACLKTPAAVLEQALGDNSASAGLRGADHLVRAAGSATRTLQEAAGTATRFSLGAVGWGLERAGAREGELLRLVLGEEAGEAVVAVGALARQLAEPMAEVPLPELLSAARAWGALQRAAGAARASDGDCAELPERAERWMRFSAAAFGSSRLGGMVEGASLPAAAQRAWAEREGGGEAATALAWAGVDGDVHVVAFEQGQQGGVFVPAYMVAVDHCSGCVVVSIRGTGSARDALTDLVCHPVPVELGGQSGEAHCGMLRAARGLESALAELAEQGLRQLRGGPRRVVICGHSLGAGVAALVAALWRDSGRLAGVDVRCVAFACPPVLDPLLAASLRNHTTSVVLEDDMVPRLSLATVRDLQSALLCTVRPRAFELDAAPLAEQTGAWERSGDAGSLASAHAAVRAAACSAEGQLRPPGRLLHMPAPAAGAPRCVREAEAEEFGELLLASDMAGAHMPWRYLAALREVVGAAPLA